MAVTSDNKLLLCNRQSSHHKVYIYKDYKTYEDEISFTSGPYCITTSPSFMNSVSVCLLSCCTCGCCTFIDLYLIGQGRVICETDPNEEKIKREKDEISELTSVLKENKQELEFLKHHGSNNQVLSSIYI
jgi:hypothetical protein